MESVTLLDKSWKKKTLALCWVVYLAITMDRCRHLKNYDKIDDLCDKCVGHDFSIVNSPSGVLHIGTWIKFGYSLININKLKFWINFSLHSKVDEPYTILTDVPNFIDTKIKSEWTILADGLLYNEIKFP